MIKTVQGGKVEDVYTHGTRFERDRALRELEREGKKAILVLTSEETMDGRPTRQRRATR